MRMGTFDKFIPGAEHMNSIIIPRTAPEFAEDLPVVDRVTFLGKKGLADITRWDPEHRVIQARMAEPDRAVIRTFNFPGWTLTVDDKPAAIEPFAALGAISSRRDPGQHRIALNSRNTIPRRIGTIISLAALALLLGIMGIAQVGLLRVKAPAETP